MTATEVFIRFAKENGYYSILHKCIREAFLTTKHRTENGKERELKYDALKKMHGDKNFMADILLKESGYCLFRIFYSLVGNSSKYRTLNYYIKRKIEEKWSKYIRTKLNGNYYKRLLRDTTDEVEHYIYQGKRYKSRIGYHALDFSFKENK